MPGKSMNWEGSHTPRPCGAISATKSSTVIRSSPFALMTSTISFVHEACDGIMEGGAHLCSESASHQTSRWQSTALVIAASAYRINCKYLIHLHETHRYEATRRSRSPVDSSFNIAVSRRRASRSCASDLQHISFKMIHSNQYARLLAQLTWLQLQLSSNCRDSGGVAGGVHAS